MHADAVVLKAVPEVRKQTRTHTYAQAHTHKLVANI